MLKEILSAASTTTSSSSSIAHWPLVIAGNYDPIPVAPYIEYNSAIGSNIASSGENFSPIGSWGFAMAIIGAILLFFCFLPGFLNTLRTKDTSQMSIVMWIITWFGLAFLVIFYAIGMANSTHTVTPEANAALAPVYKALGYTGSLTFASYKSQVSSQFTVVFTCEGASLILSTYVLLFKIFNMIKAKSMGITEGEYCAELAKKAEAHRQAKLNAAAKRA